MSWTKEETPRDHNAWQIPKSEVTIHEETSAVEDLDIYPENLSLLPTLIQHGQPNWQQQSVNLQTEWIENSNFYIVRGGWTQSFYAVHAGWIGSFYAVHAGWIENYNFYALSGSSWNNSFYAVLTNWLSDAGFYSAGGVWTDSFYALTGVWEDPFYTAGGEWYLQSDAGEGILNSFPFVVT